jgi:lysophospholipid acyltransferase (LPLAT)-like uncharacterized protein
MFLYLPGRLAKTLLRLSLGDGATAERKIAITQKISLILLAWHGKLPIDNCVFGNNTTGFALIEAEFSFCR